jgi:hypothetical protein
MLIIIAIIITTAANKYNIPSTNTTGTGIPNTIRDNINITSVIQTISKYLIIILLKSFKKII